MWHELKKELLMMKSVKRQAYFIIAVNLILTLTQLNIAKFISHGNVHSKYAKGVGGQKIA